MNATTGELTSWDPHVISYGTVNDIAVDGETVYLGGDFGYAGAP